MRKILIALISSSMSIGCLNIFNTLHAQASMQFRYGCGTGCSVDAKLIGSVKVFRTGSDSTIIQGNFLKRITGGGRGDENYSITNYVLANCEESEIMFLKNKPGFDDQGFIPAQSEHREWIKMTGTNSDYTTVVGGRGYYFDALCKHRSANSEQHQILKQQADRHYANNEYQQAIVAYSEAIRLSSRYASLYGVVA
jgi:hypothetical protein